MPKTFEDVEPLIEGILKKARGKWRLEAVKHYTYDDFKQDVKIHIWNKFHKWDQEQGFEPWCSAVIHNQMQNKKRNLWINHDKPCTNCYFNKGMGACSFTKSGTQCSECPEYEEWKQKRMYAHELKNAASVEAEDGEELYASHGEVDYDLFIKKLDQEVKRHLDKNLINMVTYKIFKYSYLDKLPDEEISKKMGYKTNEKNRSSGYRILSIHRKIVQEIAREMLKKEDYNFL